MSRGGGDWLERAACRGMDPASFFPRSLTEVWQTRRLVRELCPTCPVRAECEMCGVWWAADGWWGGLSPGDLDEIRAVENVPPLVDRKGVWR